MLSKKLLILFIVVLFTVLQCTLLNYIRIFEIKPDILLILIIFFSLYHGQIYGLAVGALCALFSEATCGLPTGAAVFTYSLGGLLLGHIARWVYKRGIFGQMSMSFIFCCVIYLFLFLVFQTFGATSVRYSLSNGAVPIRWQASNGAGLSLVNALSFIILPASFYTACISPLVFRFLKIVLNISGAPQISA